MVESTFENEDQALRDGMDMALCAIDPDNQKTFLNLIMEDGTVLMHEQTNAGESNQIKMAARSSGDERAGVAS